MINLNKGLSLFISPSMAWCGALEPMRDMMRFLSEDDINCVYFSMETKGEGDIVTEPYVKRVEIPSIPNWYDEIPKIIKENTFRANLLVFNITTFRGGYWRGGKKEESVTKSIGDMISLVEETGLCCIIITQASHTNEMLDMGFHFHTIYNIEKNPEFDKERERGNGWLHPGAAIPEYPDKWRIHNLNTEDKFTIDQFKKSYVRDAKLKSILK
jgi:hypothetical protein